MILYYDIWREISQYCDYKTTIAITSTNRELYAMRYISDIFKSKTHLIKFSKSKYNNIIPLPQTCYAGHVTLRDIKNVDNLKSVLFYNTHTITISRAELRDIAPLLSVFNCEQRGTKITNIILFDCQNLDENIFLSMDGQFKISNCTKIEKFYNDNKFLFGLGSGSGSDPYNESINLSDQKYKYIYDKFCTYKNSKLIIHPLKNATAFRVGSAKFPIVIGRPRRKKQIKKNIQI